MNYEQDIIIDENSLDIEWLNQPTLFMKYARHGASMRREVDKMKQALDIARADADSKIRNHPEKYKLEKITEAAVSNAILKEDGYKQAYQDYLDAKYESDIAQAAVLAFEQRKSALENIVKLHGQSYFAGPKVPRDLSNERKKKEEERKERDNRVGSKLSRTK